MNLLLRMLVVVTTALMSRNSLDLLGESVLTFRVLPTDLDLNGHMNNGRYLTLMDLGRIDLTIRCGLMQQAMQRNWRPVVGGTIINYKRSLMPFEIYQLKTRLVYWDEKWVFLEQRFERNGVVVAVGIIKGVFRHPQTGNVPASQIAQSMGIHEPSPEVPPGIHLWLQAEANLLSSPALVERSRKPVPILTKCTTPGCENPVLEPQETGRYCSACALEQDLFDRQPRWDELAARSKAA